MVNRDNISDTYLKKIIHFKHEGINFEFKVSQSLFSSYNIDNGTYRLLRCLRKEEIKKHKKILDLGCGYGPLGIVLNSINKSLEVQMVDRDALAVEFAKINSEDNGVGDIKVYGSLGYGNVIDNDFDLIVSNIPAKVGTKMLSRMLLAGSNYLTTNGQMAIVVIDAIYKQVEEILSDPSIKILLHKKWPGHHVLKYEFNKSKIQSKFKKNVWEDKTYDREVVEVSLSKSLKFSIQTTYNLPEFDTLSFDTDLLLSNLNILKNIKIKKALFFNPNHGYLPVAVSKLKNISDVVLADHNLQALEVSKINLIKNGYSATNISLLHQVGIEGERGEVFDSIIGVVAEKEDKRVLGALVDQLALLMSNSSVALIASNSRTITSLEKLIKKTLKLKISKKIKSKGRMMISIINK